jgi:hypothetical protein
MAAIVDLENSNIVAFGVGLPYRMTLPDGGLTEFTAIDDERPDHAPRFRCVEEVDVSKQPDYPHIEANVSRYFDGNVVTVNRVYERAQPITVIDGATFLARVTDDEYAAIIGAALTNPKIGRWIDIFRLRGEIDVAGSTALAAKAGLVAAGLLTLERAEVIFSHA